MRKKLLIVVAMFAMCTAAAAADLGKTGSRTDELRVIDLDRTSPAGQKIGAGRPTGDCESQFGVDAVVAIPCGEIPPTLACSVSGEAFLCPRAQSDASRQCRGRRNVCEGSCSLTLNEMTATASGGCRITCAAEFSGACEKTTGKP